MIICNHCGAPVPDSAGFCGECGTPNVSSQGGGTRPVAPPPLQPEPIYPPPGPPVYPAPPEKSNTGLILGLLAVLILGGIGLFALALNNSRRSKTDVDVYVPTPTPTNNRNAQNSSGNTNTNRNGNYNYANVNQANTNYNSNYNTNYNSASVSPYQRAENKIRSQDYLNIGELSGLDCYDLKLLRNTFFAKYGRVFEEPELKRYFGSKSWYKPDDAYRSNTQNPGITSIDETNIEVVKAAEDRQACRRGK